MLHRALMLLKRMVSVPFGQDAIIPARLEDAYRDSVWVAREKFQAAENWSRREWFDDVAILLKLPRVPDFMGPWPQRRLLAACAVASQPAQAPVPEEPRKASVHLVATRKKAVAE